MIGRSTSATRIPQLLFSKAFRPSSRATTARRSLRGERAVIEGRWQGEFYVSLAPRTSFSLENVSAGTEAAAAPRVLRPSSGRLRSPSRD